MKILPKRLTRLIKKYVIRPALERIADELADVLTKQKEKREGQE